MKTAGGSAAAKRRAGERAAAEVEDGMIVGLGTGSTTAYAIDAIGRAVENGLDVRGVPTSYQSRHRATSAGIPLTSLDAVERIDLAIDGADQCCHPQQTGSKASVDDSQSDGSTEPSARSSEQTADSEPTARGTLLKGGGGAHAREKLLAVAADRFVVVVDRTKLVSTLDLPVPLAVLPDAHTVVADLVCELGGQPTLRTADCKDGPVVTDDGNVVLDCSFGSIEDPRSLARQLSALPGVLEHGLFIDLADDVYVGTEDGVERITL